MAFESGGGGGLGGTKFEFPDLSGLKKNLGMLRWLLPGLVILILLVTSVYTVQPEEVGIVLRLGKFHRETPPGLHIRLPFRIETLYKLPVQRQLKAEFGYETVQAGVRSETRNRPEESSMLTGDLNAAVVEWVVQ